MMRKILFAVLTLAACANDNGTGDDNGTDDTGDGGGGGSGSGGDDISAADRQQDYDDVAGSIGAKLSAGELAVMVDAINVGYGRVPDGFTFVDNGPERALRGTRGGLTLEYEAYCRDAAEAIVPCNGAAAHGHFSVTYSGSIAGAAMDGVLRSANWSVRDLLSPSPRIGGKGTDDFAATLSTGDYAFVVSDTLNRVRFQPTPTGPLSGKVDLVANVQRARASTTPASRTFDVTVVIDFTGGDTATITLDGTKIYALTLSTGAVVKR